MEDMNLTEFHLSFPVALVVNMFVSSMIKDSIRYRPRGIFGVCDRGRGIMIEGGAETYTLDK